MKVIRLLVAIIIALAASFTLGDEITEGDNGMDVISSVPRSMTYQGILKNSTGEPVADTSLFMAFKIYTAPTGGTYIWYQAITVNTDGGGYFVVTLPDLNLPFDTDYYLEMQVEDDAAMSPRQKLAVSAYAARADTSQYSVAGGGWVDDGSVVRLAHSSDDVSIGTTEPPAVKVDVGDMVRVQGEHYPDFPTTGAGLELAYRPYDNTGIVQVVDRDAGTDAWGDLYLGSGNVGIGISYPTTDLHVVGDVTVTGAMYTPFPRPAYDSGWFTLDRAEDTTLVHNLGGSTSNYFVDFQMRYDDNTISNLFDGGDWETVASLPAHRGASYRGLTNTEIGVYSHGSEYNYVQYRVRIWVIE